MIKGWNDSRLLRHFSTHVLEQRKPCGSVSLTRFGWITDFKIQLDGGKDGCLEKPGANDGVTKCRWKSSLVFYLSVHVTAVLGAMENSAFGKGLATWHFLKMRHLAGNEARMQPVAKQSTKTGRGQLFKNIPSPLKRG